MAKMRTVNTKFWDDSYIVTLDPIEKLLFLYFLTNPLTDICGIYEIPLKRVAYDTGIDNDMIQKILLRFESHDKIIYRNGWIYIKNFVKNQVQNPSVLAGVQRAFNEIPQNIKDSLGTDCDSLVHLTKLNLTKLNLKEESPEASRLSKLLLEEILKNNPNSRLHHLSEKEKENIILKWGKDIDLILKKDRQSPSIVEEVIRFCHGDSFWRANILSGKKLREKWDTLILQKDRILSRNKVISEEPVDSSGRRLKVLGRGNTPEY